MKSYSSWWLDTDQHAWTPGLRAAPVDAGLLPWVHHYLCSGWPLLPLYEIAGSTCSCFRAGKCRSPGKHPRIPNGFNGASFNPDLVRSWFVRWPSANVGIATGQESGLVVLDVDLPHDGESSLMALERHHGALPETYFVRTGRGFHFYYLSPPGAPVASSVGHLGKGVDIRGDRAYVVAPPSNHMTGRRYEVLNPGPVTPLPSWVVEAVNAKKTPERVGSRTAHRRGPTPNSQSSERPLPRTEDEVVHRVLTATEGTRNNTLNTMAFLAGRWAANGRTSEAAIKPRLTLAACLSGLDEEEAERTFASGFDAGFEDQNQ